MRLKPIDPTYHFALSQVFSPSFVTKINDPSQEELVKSLLHKCGLLDKRRKWSLLKGLQITYDYLKKNYRCEYVYKNEIANQLLLKYHNDNSATLLKEVTSITSLADIVIINGQTVAYEIKTELDNFERLDKQIDSYRSLYDFVNVVTHRSAFEALKRKVDDNIGIIILEDDGNLITERQGTSNSHLFDKFKAIFTLRHSELLTAYKKYVGKIPTIGTAAIHELCYNWYLTLEQEDAHIVFHEALKSRRPSQDQFKLVQNSPPSLKMMFLGREIPRKYCIATMDKFGIFE